MYKIQKQERKKTSRNTKTNTNRKGKKNRTNIERQIQKKSKKKRSNQLKEWNVNSFLSCMHFYHEGEG
jgi:hypothetical protein